MKNFIVGCVYRPPNTDVNAFNVECESILNIVKTVNDQLFFIMGDFNLDLLQFADHQPTQTFLNNMISHSMFPSIRNPTRITEKCATLIDNIF